MTNARDLILFFVITFCILFGWSVFVESPMQQEQQHLDALKELENDADILAPTTSNVTEQENANNDIISSLVPREHLVSDTNIKRVTIDTPKLQGSIALTGAVIDDLTLKDYKTEKDSDSPPIVLLSPSKAFNAYFARFGWITTDSAIRVPDAKSVWNTNSKSLTNTNPVTLTWDNREGQIFKLTISIDDKYMFSISQRIENYGTNDINLYPFGMINRIWNQTSSGFLILHEGALGTMDSTLSEVTYSDLKDDQDKIYRDSSGWFGLTDKYWLTAIYPDQSAPFRVNFKHKDSSNSDRYQVDFLGPQTLIRSGDNHETTHQFFAGAKEIRILDHYTNEANISLFDRAIDFGVLYVMTKPIFIVLQFFNGYLGNFGLAIMALTVVIKIFLFPLANKSYRSFAQMKKLAPEVERIKKDFKDDRQAQSQQIMALYRREKVNPVAGCLPILVQIPVFFALYKVLFVTIEMRHAPFYGWINDLSAKDPTTIFNLFGLIPWDPPSFLMIGVLPLLMSITMVIQQKLNPPPSDPVQAKVMTFLPWIFLFLFASFPAGLVLYWVWNNMLSILQQWTITRIIMKEK